MSVCVMPMVAAKKAGQRANDARRAKQSVRGRRSGLSGHHVHAGRYHGGRVNEALTGVGPSIASGSQTYSGICADFPLAPTNSRRRWP